MIYIFVLPEKGLIIIIILESKIVSKMEQYLSEY